VKSQSFTSVQAKSYPTHNPTFSTNIAHNCPLSIRVGGRFASMKAAALLTAFLIGLVAGITFSQPLNIEISSKPLKEDIRRGID
jgi:hypothetical protein